MVVVLMDSNTTLVKVKSPYVAGLIAGQKNSNTTLVKVKLYIRSGRVLVFEFKYNTC